MNATELAFLLDKSRKESYTSENLVGKAATMLRQQQAEIEALKNENQYFKDRLHSLETLRKAQDK